MKLARFMFELICGAALFVGMFWIFYAAATIAYVH